MKIVTANGKQKVVMTRKEWTAIGKLAQWDLNSLQVDFPFHEVQQKIDDAYMSVAKDNSPTIPARLSSVLKEAYPAWKAYFSKLTPDQRDLYELAAKVDKLFRILISGDNLTDWKEGVINLKARLSDAHSSLYRQDKPN